MKLLACTTRADAFGAGLVLRARSGEGAMSQAERDALLAEVRSNPGTTARLQIEVTSYLQRETPNRNHVRFSAKRLAAIAKSFVGMPFLRNHDQDDIAARGGTIVASEMIAGDVPEFRQVIELTKPWAIEGVLDGTIDRFSIGWRATGAVICTACKAEYVRGVFGSYPSCEHRPGDVVKTKAGDVVAQMEFTAAEGVEVSAVSVPAVAGTGIDEVRAALSASAAEHRSHSHRSEQMNLLATLASILALSATAGEQEAVTAVERLQTDNEGLRASLKDALDREKTLGDKLKAHEQITLASRITGAVDKAIAEKRVAKGGNVHKHIEKLAARGDLDGLEAYLADLPPGSAGCIGEPLLSSQPDPTPTGGALSADEAKAARLLRLSPDEWADMKKRTAAREAARNASKEI